MTESRLHQLRHLLGERYEFRSLLGRGGFASVYLVRNLHLDRLEALKVLSQDVVDGEKSAQRFVIEAKVVASLDHPNLVKVYDYGESSNILWCAMQYIDGPTLRQELDVAGRLSEEAVATLAVPLLDALGYSHSMGTIHRDIKPSNILLSARGRPYLTDFGIAKSIKSNLHTKTGNLWGTPAYMAPELIESKPIDGRADLYSLGMLLYELLAGCLPFVADSPVQLALRRVQEDAPPISDLLPSIDRQVEALVMKALARKPDDRYESAAEMRDAWIRLVGDDWRQRRVQVKAEPPSQRQLPIGGAGGKEKGVKPDAGAAALAPTIPARKPPKPVVKWLALLLVAFLGVWLWTSTRSTDLVEIEQKAPPEDGELKSELASDEPRAATEETPSDAGSSDTSPVQDDETAISVPAPEDSSTEAVDLEEETLETTPANEPPPPVVRKRQAPSPAPASPPRTSAPEPPAVRRPVTAAAIKTTAQIRITENAASQCTGSQVVATVEIDTEGVPTGAKILKAAATPCGDAVRQALLDYRFRPALAADGLPIASKMTLSLKIGETTP
ncbi:MAG: protein kinase [Deltaproteobacteria bacterium]|nr:protein kinase [Deltaproteobacteria bacterium]